MNHNMKPCNVKHENIWYHCAADGTVTLKADGAPVDATMARAVKQTVARLRRNKRRRLRDATMRDLGLLKTPYGWE